MLKLFLIEIKVISPANLLLNFKILFLVTEKDTLSTFK